MNPAAQSKAADYEVVVLGGGITGLSIARACARAGLKTALFEKGKIGLATSSNSLRIIHGGFRYLQSLNLPRVIRSLKDQARVQREFPKLVRVLPCYLPLEGIGLKSRYPVCAASLLYLILAKLCGLDAPASEVLRPEIAHKRLPILIGRAPHGAFVWHDLQLHDPGALHQRLARDIIEAGGAVLENHAATAVHRAGQGFNITTGDEVVGSRFVVNALGPWINSVMIEENRDLLPARLGWCRAFNLVYHGNPFGTFGVGIPTDDGRFLFAVGRDNEISIGTEYLALEGSAQTAAVSQPELEAFHRKILRAMPTLALDLDQLDRVELGVLPIEQRHRLPEEELIGSAQITNHNGYITVLSTKYTTFLSQADRVLALIRE